MSDLPGSLRYALRQFRMAPVFTAAAVLTLALGIGGTTAIFTLIHAVMLRSLPVTDPGRLYRVGEGDDCCVEGGAAGQVGDVFVRFVRATEEGDAGIRGSGGLPGGTGQDWGAAAGRGGVWQTL